ncbi:hypothetical protein IWZ01DRAFT_322431 [Phyllosticta capitalensis]
MLAERVAQWKVRKEIHCRPISYAQELTTCLEGNETRNRAMNLGLSLIPKALMSWFMVLIGLLLPLFGLLFMSISWLCQVYQRKLPHHRPPTSLLPHCTNPRKNYRESLKICSHSLASIAYLFPNGDKSRRRFFQNQRRENSTCAESLCFFQWTYVTIIKLPLLKR